VTVDARPDSQPTLLLVGHGTRSRAGQQEFHRLAAQVRARLPAFRTLPCFLELAEPSLAAILSELREEADLELLVAPVLLFSAGHAKRDIPSAVRAILRAEVAARARFTPVLHAQRNLLALSAKRFQEAIAPAPALESSERLLLWVARGSSDPAARANLEAFARARQALVPAAQEAFAFCAITQPLLPEALASASQQPFRQIVVQPHFLFSGQLPDEVFSRVAEFARGDASRDWRVCRLLEADALLADALAELVAETSAQRTLAEIERDADAT